MLRVVFSDQFLPSILMVLSRTFKQVLNVKYGLSEEIRNP